MDNNFLPFRLSTLELAQAGAAGTEQVISAFNATVAPQRNLSGTTTVHF